MSIAAAQARAIHRQWELARAHFLPQMDAPGQFSSSSSENGDGAAGGVAPRHATAAPQGGNVASHDGSGGRHRGSARRGGSNRRIPRQPQPQQVAPRTPAQLDADIRRYEDAVSHLVSADKGRPAVCVCVLTCVWQTCMACTASIFATGLCCVLHLAGTMGEF
jgi:hypothetical protein